MSGGTPNESGCQAYEKADAGAHVTPAAHKILLGSASGLYPVRFSITELGTSGTNWTALISTFAAHLSHIMAQLAQTSISEKPICVSYFYDNTSGQVRKALSGYTLKPGSRGTRSNTNPGGDYDGMYNDDWEFTDSGDLDECNGMSLEGQYGYYVTDTYPWVLKCFSGTPHESFGGSNPGTRVGALQ